MKTKYLIIPLLLMIFSVSQKAYAQANTDWQILKLDVAGRTISEGVEAYALVSKCKDDDVIYLKIVNHNEHTVTVKWFDALQSQQQIWVVKNDPSEHKSITLEPNKEMKGDCVANNYKECIIKVKDFIDKQNNFKEYAIYHFEVIAVIR